MPRRSCSARAAVGLAATFLGIRGSAAAVPAHIRPRWDAPPKATPSNDSPDGPVFGNGRVGVAVSGAAGALTFHLDRNDAWVPATGDLSCCGYDPEGAGRRTVGLLSVTFPAETASNASVFAAEQIISNGTVTTAQKTAGGGVLRSKSYVPRGVDAVVTELWWEVPAEQSAKGRRARGGAGPAPAINVTAVAAQSGKTGTFCHTFSAGGVINSTATWASRTLGFPYQNVPTSTIGRRHFYKAAWSVASTRAPSGARPRGRDSRAPVIHCIQFDGDCAACQAHNETVPPWNGTCLMLDGAAQAGHTCVPATWWAEYNKTYAPVEPCARGCTGCPVPQAPGLIHLTANRPAVTLVTAVMSNFQTDNYTDPTQGAQDLAVSAAADPSTVQAWRSSHVAWWDAFWNKSGVSLPTGPQFETQWYGSLYILASSHDAGGGNASVAPGIVWPATTDSPAFRGAFTMNYNQEALYYGVYSANHPELATPFYNAMVQYVPRGNRDAWTQFQCPGVNVDCEIFHWGQSTSGVGDQGQRSNSLLAAVPFANHWLWTRDTAWLNQTGWPYLSEVAAFWECYLPRGKSFPGTPPGSYSSVNDCFNELCSSAKSITNVNPHISMALLYFLLPVFSDAASALGVAADRRAVWADLLKNLAPLPVATLPDGTRVFGGVLGAEAGSMPAKGGNPLTSYLGWPGYDDRVTSDSELRALVVNTVNYLESWSCGNCWPQFPAAKMRAQNRTADAQQSWMTMASLLDKMTAPNLIVQDGPGNMATAMEGAAGIGTVDEMLMQSHTLRGIELFPQVPPGVPAAFQNLRARGGLLVSATMASEVVSGFTVANDARDGSAAATARFKSPWWPNARGVAVTDTASGAPPPGGVSITGDGWFAFSAATGRTYAIKPTSPH